MDHSKELLRQFYTFRVVFHLGEFTRLVFYSILLYKTFGRFEELIIDKAVMFSLLWIGMSAGSLLIHRLGYLATYRIVFGLLAFSSLFYFFSLPHLEELYVFNAILRGLPAGIYWALYRTFVLEDLSGKGRRDSFHIIIGIILAIEMVMPFALGSLIDFSGTYGYVFLLSTVFFTVGLFISFKYNKIPHAHVTLKEFVEITKQKHFSQHSIKEVIRVGLESLNELMFSVIPYVLIGTEFGVGALASVIGIFAVAATLMERRVNLQQEIKITFAGYSIQAIATTVLSIFWTLPVLVVRSLIDTFINSVTIPLQRDVEYTNTERLMGSHRQEYALEMNIISEFLFLMGRLGAFLIFFIFIIYARHMDVSLIRIFVAFFAIWKIGEFAWELKLRRIFEKEPAQ